MTRQLDDAATGPESSILKRYLSTYQQRVTELATDVLGPDAAVLSGRGAVAHLGPDPLCGANHPAAWEMVFRARGHHLRRIQSDPTQPARRAGPRTAPPERASREMRFAHTSEQEELSAVTRQFLAAKSGIDDLRRVIDTPAGHDPDVWAELAELGLLGLTAREREKLRMASRDVDIEDSVMVPHTVSASLVTLKQSGPRSP